MTNGATGTERGAYDPDRVMAASGLLGEFNAAGILCAADVHVAMRLCRLGNEPDEQVALAAALAVRGPRFGHVRVDLSRVHSTVAADFEADPLISNLPWPDPASWLEKLQASPLVATEHPRWDEGDTPDGVTAADGATAAGTSAGPVDAGIDAGPVDRPLRLTGTALYLDRYWRDEAAVARDLLRRSSAQQPDVDDDLLGRGIARLLGSASIQQKWAAATGVTRRLAVVAGGPGTGKTTVIARIIALLHEQHSSGSALSALPPLVALAAPTGKAAARMQEAVRTAASDLDTEPWVRDRLARVEALTIHRLLRSRPDSSSRFRHNRANLLPHDVVVVDETSMVPLSLMARLLEAVRGDARLILVGDPEQLASVEAGAVLGDIVGPAATAPCMGAATATRLGALTGFAAQPSPRPEPPHGGDGSRRPDSPRPELPHPPDSPCSGERLPPIRWQTVPSVTGELEQSSFGDGIVLLRDNFRLSDSLSALATCIRVGDDTGAISSLRSGEQLAWIETGPEEALELATRPLAASALLPLWQAVVDHGRDLYGAAVEGDAGRALQALGRFRILCGHRRGAGGLEGWTGAVETWLATSVDGFEPYSTWYLGRPVLVNANDYSLRLFNGDTGVVAARDGGGLVVVFDQGASLLEVTPSRLSGVETVFATTVHKSQGSEFDRVALILPAEQSPLLTRELLYTAVTRARQGLILVGTEEAVRTAVTRPISRASGLTKRLWGDSTAD